MQQTRVLKPPPALLRPLWRPVRRSNHALLRFRRCFFCTNLARHMRYTEELRIYCNIACFGSRIWTLYDPHICYHYRARTGNPLYTPRGPLGYISCTACTLFVCRRYTLLVDHIPTLYSTHFHRTRSPHKLGSLGAWSIFVDTRNPAYQIKVD